MEKNLISLLMQMLGNQSPPPPQQSQSTPYSPPEAYSQTQQASPQQNNAIAGLLSQFMAGNHTNSPLAMLSSIMGKDNPLASILSSNNKKEADKPTSSPKDEILL